MWNVATPLGDGLRPPQDTHLALVARCQKGVAAFSGFLS